MSDTAEETGPALHRLYPSASEITAAFERIRGNDVRIMSATRRCLTIMTDMNLSGVYRAVESERRVLVERDGVWYPGELQGWRRSAEGWLAAVDYVAADDVHYLELVKDDRIQR